MEVIGIIYVWAVLVLVVLGYVIYRLVTDKRTADKKHPLYPLVSYPTDGLFPEKGRFRQWLVYILVCVVLVFLLINVFSAVYEST